MVEERIDHQLIPPPQSTTLPQIIIFPHSVELRNGKMINLRIIRQPIIIRHRQPKYLRKYNNKNNNKNLFSIVASVHCDGNNTKSNRRAEMKSKV